MRGSFSFEPHVAGEHVHVTVRAGEEGQRALCGVLVLRADEWEALRALVEPAAPAPLSVGERLAEIARLRRSLTSSEYTFEHLHGPTPELVAYAQEHGCWHATDGSGFSVLDVTPVDQVTVHDVPAPPPRAPAPLPSCSSCGSTACPARCPCGAWAAVPDVDMEIPF